MQALKNTIVAIMMVMAALGSPSVWAQQPAARATDTAITDPTAVDAPIDVDESSASFLKIIQACLVNPTRSDCVMFYLVITGGAITGRATHLAWNQVFRHEEYDKIKNYARKYDLTTRQLMLDNERNHREEYNAAIKKSQQAMADAVTELLRLSSKPDMLTPQLKPLQTEYSELDATLKANSSSLAQLALQLSVGNLPTAQISEKKRLQKALLEKRANIEKRMKTVSARITAKKAQIQDAEATVASAARRVESTAIRHAILAHPPETADDTLLKKWPQISQHIEDNLHTLVQHRKQLKDLVHEIKGHPGAEAAIGLWDKNLGTKPLALWLNSPEGQAFLKTPEGSDWNNRLNHLMKASAPLIQETSDVYNARALQNRANQSVDRHRSILPRPSPVAPLLRAAVPDTYEGGEIVDPARFFWQDELEVPNEFKRNVDHRAMRPVVNSEPDHQLPKVVADRFESECAWATSALENENRSLSFTRVVRSWFADPRVLIPAGAGFLAGFGWLYHQTEANRAKIKAAKEAKKKASSSLLGDFQREHERGKADRLIPFRNSVYSAFTRKTKNKDGQAKSLANKIYDAMHSSITSITGLYSMDKETREKKLHELNDQHGLWQDPNSIQNNFENALREEAEARGYNMKAVIDTLYGRSANLNMAKSDGKDFFLAVVERAIKKIYAGVVDDQFHDSLKKDFYSDPVQVVRDELKKMKEILHTVDDLDTPSPAGFGAPVPNADSDAKPKTTKDSKSRTDLKSPGDAPLSGENSAPSGAASAALIGGPGVNSASTAANLAAKMPPGGESDVDKKH